MKDGFCIPQFPRASAYHPDWILAGASGGANPLWLTEWLSEAMSLRPGMRVLDLGCGRALSSIFLYREFGVQVWATDLWFSASENQQRVRDANEKRSRNDPLPTMDEIIAPYGSSYRLMLEQVHDTLANAETLFPELQGRKPRLAGFVWFQGWNDQYGAENDYEQNMRQLILDVRRDLNSPDLPVVIGVMGQNGSTPATGAMLTIQQAQLAMNGVPEFQGNVKAIRTDELVDEAAEKLYPEWKERFEEWKLTGGDHRYHYLGSAIWFTRIGHAMSEAMLELQNSPRPQ
ncbi:MAG: hypothetical protein KDA96_05085 [Planctomycetaceae bacterium]|nr:hypothetical protein [Planctomycetaceae bacterium]